MLKHLRMNTYDRPNHDKKKVILREYRSFPRLICNPGVCERENRNTADAELFRASKQVDANKVRIRGTVYIDRQLSAKGPESFFRLNQEEMSILTLNVERA